MPSKRDAREERCVYVCAERGTRTLTLLRAHAPEACVYTSFTTSAWQSTSKKNMRREIEVLHYSKIYIFCQESA